MLLTRKRVNLPRTCDVTLVTGDVRNEKIISLFSSGSGSSSVDMTLGCDWSIQLTFWFCQLPLVDGGQSKLVKYFFGSCLHLWLQLPPSSMNAGVTSSNYVKLFK